MQKKIIALAVAGLVSGVAFAQSNVTIYGSLDASYTYARGGNATSGTANTGTKTFSGVTGGQWNGNRVGFKGEEALGNGLKAIFTYEFGAPLEGQGGLTSSRQAFVGLDTDYGSFTVGRQYAPSGVLMGKNSAFDVASTTPLNNFIAQSGATMSPLLSSTMGTGNTARWNNSISFISKTYSGFSARAIYAFSNTVGGASNTGAGTYETSTTDNGKFGLSLTYANGPLNADVIYQSQQNVRVSVPNVSPFYVGTTATATLAPTVNGLGNDINEWYAGASYDFQVVKVFGSYQKLTNKNNNAIAANADSKVWSLGASVPVSAAGKVRAEYARISFDPNTSANSTLNGDSSSYGVGYTHDLSKRTMLYTSVTRVKNDLTSYGFSGNNNIGVGAAGQSNTVFTSGVRHFF